jgi:hypothetical protein
MREPVEPVDVAVRRSAVRQQHERSGAVDAERPREITGNLGSVARLVAVRHTRREADEVERGVFARKRLRRSAFGVVEMEHRRAIVVLGAHDEACAV